MPRWIKQLLKYLGTSGERLLFGLVGAACLFFTFRFLVAGQVTSASAVFAMAFFSFFYSNLARFKKFKGLGFEAELWEDKQKEAANLIDRLKSVVAIYTREIVMNSVMRGRWSDGESWEKRWALFDELVDQHNALGQEIDFSDLKSQLDGVFIFDLCTPLSSSVRKSIEEAKAKTSEQMAEKYAKVVTDLDGHNADLKKLGEVKAAIENLFERAGQENIANTILKLADDAKEKLSAFSIVPDFNPTVLERLRAISEVAENRPMVVTPQLLQWSSDRSTFK